jgi:hypothetical protein
MSRIHLFEFEDQKWFPAFLRNYLTDFLQFISNKTGMYKPAIPILVNGLNKSNTHQIIDLCSGGGGGLIWLNNELKSQLPNLKITLTDYYPNIPAFTHTQKQAANIDYISSPVDARKVPIDLKGMRTLFLSFHHFKQVDAFQILQNAVDTNSPIAIFEAQERSVLSIIGILLSPISLILVTPFIRPFKLGRILFTYLIPLVPLFALWDGIVSCLRTYSVNEMQELVHSLNGSEKFQWDINKVRSGPGVILYLLGTPKY